MTTTTTTNGADHDDRDSDRDFQELAAAWRATQPAGLSGLPERVRRRNLLSGIVIAFEIVMSIVGLAVLGWFLSTGPSPLWLVWVAFMGVTTVAFAAFSLRARAGTWRAERPGVLGLLELSIRQARSSILLARGAALSTVVILAFTAGWATLEVLQLEDPSPEGLRRRALVYGAVVLYCLGWLVGCRLWRLRKTRELESLERSLEELGTLDDRSVSVRR